MKFAKMSYARRAERYAARVVREYRACGHVSTADKIRRAFLAGLRAKK